MIIVHRGTQINTDGVIVVSILINLPVV